MHIYVKWLHLQVLSSFALIAMDLPSLSAALSNSEEQKIQDHLNQTSQEPGAVMFTPPPGWHLAKPESLPPSVKVMVIGKGEQEFPPSINLGTENYNGTLKQYLKQIKTINASQGHEWRDLGTIQTEAGEASYSQAIMKTPWGQVKMMHVILLKKDVVYILTAAALQEEFPRFYKAFFESLRSLRMNPDLYDMVKESERRTHLEKAEVGLKNSLKSSMAKQQSPATTFESEQYQKNYWEPFKAMLSQDYNDLGISWRTQLLDKIQREITEQ